MSQKLCILACTSIILLVSTKLTFGFHPPVGATKKYAVGNRVKEYVVKSNRHGNYMELFLIQLMVLCMVPIRFDEIGSLFNIFKEFDTAYRRVTLTQINKCCARESADMNHKLLVDYS